MQKMLTKQCQHFLIFKCRNLQRQKYLPGVATLPARLPQAFLFQACK